MRRQGALLAAMLLTALFLAAPSSAMASKPSGNSGGFDAAPCLDLLAKMLGSIPRGDEEAFNESLWWFKQIPVPQDMAYDHSRIIEALQTIAYNAWTAEGIMAEAEGLLGSGDCSGALIEARLAESRLIKAFSAKDDLFEDNILGDYVSAAARHINDTGLRFLLERGESLASASLEEYLDDLRSSLASLISEASECRAGVKLALSLKANATELHPGETLRIYGRLTGNSKPLQGREIRVSLRLGGLELGGEGYTDAGGYYEVNIKIPGVGGEPSIEWSSTNEMEATIYAAYRDTGGLLVFNETTIPARALSPGALFSCPRSQEYGKPLRIPVSLSASIPMNLTVYVDGEPIYNTTLTPGRSVVEIPWSNNITAGYHTLSFKIHGGGSYAGATYSCALAVGVESPAINLVVDYISIYPFSNLLVKGSIVFPKPKPHIIVLELGGEKHDLGLVEGENTTINLRLTPPPTLLIGFHTLTLRISNVESGFTSTAKYPVVVVNPLGMLAAILLVLVMVAAPPRRDLIRLSGLFLARLRRSLRRGGRAGGRLVRRVEARVEWRSRIAPIYYAALRVVARIAGAMAPSDTLREYLARASPRLGGRLRRMFSELTMMFERDLYSRIKAGSREVEEARRLAREIRRGG